MSSRTKALAAALVVLGCDALGLPAVDLERMIDQRRVEAYERFSFFPDERGMRVPPTGTMPHRPVPSEGIATGRQGGEYLASIPTPMTRELLGRGRERYEIFCAPCHGVLGNGATQVSENMTLRKPPSLVTGPIPSYRPGRVFHVITGGYGLMPSYGSALALEDRWAVVAYVQALQLSRNARLDQLPAELRSEALGMLQ